MISSVPPPTADHVEEARRLRAVFDGIVHFAGLLAPDGTLLEANRAALELIGARREAVAGRLFWETPWWPADAGQRESVHDAVRDAVLAAATGASSRFETVNVDFDGRPVTVDFSLTPVLDDGGRVVFIVPEGRDITQLQVAERVRRETEARLAGILDMAADAIVSVDEAQRITLFNKGAEAVFGYAAGEVLGQPLTILMPTEARERHPAHVATFGAASGPARFMNGRGRIVGRRKSGEIFPAEATISKLDVGGRPIFTAVLRDMTERERTEEALRALSLTDDLTGLHNRRGFLSHAEPALRQARRSHTPCLLLYFDLDDFKAINDTHGHLAGDRALIETGTMLRDVFRGSDVLGRIGGDEFIVLAVGSGVDALEPQRERVRAWLAERNAHPDMAFSLSVSIGAAASDPAGSVSLEQLMSTADAALYAEKRSRRVPA